ncbi:hypothetical protein E2562_036376, partial [Oryza meyeriana var. granulata]
KILGYSFKTATPVSVLRWAKMAQGVVMLNGKARLKPLPPWSRGKKNGEQRKENLD